MARTFVWSSAPLSSKWTPKIFSKNSQVFRCKPCSARNPGCWMNLPSKTFSKTWSKQVAMLLIAFNSPYAFCTARCFFFKGCVCLVYTSWPKEWHLTRTSNPCYSLVINKAHIVVEGNWEDKLRLGGDSFHLSVHAFWKMAYNPNRGRKVWSNLCRF